MLTPPFLAFSNLFLLQTLSSPKTNFRVLRLASMHLKSLQVTKKIRKIIFAKSCCCRCYCFQCAVVLGFHSIIYLFYLSLFFATKFCLVLVFRISNCLPRPTTSLSFCFFYDILCTLLVCVCVSL